MWVHSSIPSLVWLRNTPFGSNMFVYRAPKAYTWYSNAPLFYAAFVVHGMKPAQVHELSVPQWNHFNFRGYTVTVHSVSFQNSKCACVCVPESQRYCTVHCTGYMRTWPMSQLGLEEAEADKESSHFSCLVAVGRVHPHSTPQLNGEIKVKPTEFITRCAMDGKFTYVDQRYVRCQCSTSKSYTRRPDEDRDMSYTSSLEASGMTHEQRRSRVTCAVLS